jgi:hypothetical protein
MKFLYKIILDITLLGAVLCFSLNAQTNQQHKTIPYNWKNVQIAGGGFVDGIVFHPKEKGLCYCRTDIGGAYRRNVKTLKWEPLLDWISYKAVNLMGVESIALDPSDPNRLYLACGTYTFSRVPNGAVLCSDDRGKTFKRINVPFKMGGNENGRGNGERMAVDPKNGRIIYLGTRHNGLWKSTDRSLSWKQVASFPDVKETPPDSIRDPLQRRFWEYFNTGSGIIFTIFDPESGTAGNGSSTIYVGVSLMNRYNLFRSKDYGKTWLPVPNQPVQYRPTHAVLASNGMMYITYGDSPGPSLMKNGGVWKLNTKNDGWREITPDKPDPENRPFGYAAVSADAQNPDVLIVSSYHRYKTDNGEDIFRSTDSGISWKQVFKNGGAFDDAQAPYVSHTGIHWLFDIEIDPFDSNHAMFTIGYGGHETFDLTDMDNGSPTLWHVMTTGIEETVTLDLLSPPAGANLISAIGDYGGFVHWDSDKPAAEGNFDNLRFGNTNSVACAEKNPGIIVRVGHATNDNKDQNIGYSIDSGKTWQPASMPDKEAKLGFISLSSDGSTWIWSPSPIRHGYGPESKLTELPVYFTRNKGRDWDVCKGIPDNTRVVADKVNPKKFYGIDLFAGKLFISSDGGMNFLEMSLNIPGGIPKTRENRGDRRGGQDKIYTAPGKEGDLWIAAFDGLYHTLDEGRSSSKLNGVQEINVFGFGKGFPGSNYSALYLVGTVDGQYGIFRSDDIAKTWVRINDDKHRWGLILQITGDPRIYGRVYVGMHGRGILYGDPEI